jgi:hypothetical protein
MIIYIIYKMMGNPAHNLPVIRAINPLEMPLLHPAI